MKKCMGCMNDYEDSKIVCPMCGYSEAAAMEQWEKAPDTLRPETILQGRFIIGRVLSLSFYSVIYLSWDALLSRRVVIRELFPYELVKRDAGSLEVRPRNASAEELMAGCLERFEQEGKLLSLCQDIPGVLDYYRTFRENGTAYTVTEYLEGNTLEDLYSEGKKASAEFCRQLVMRIGTVLDQLHTRGVIHANLSPSGIYINAEGEVILIDFGMTKRWLCCRIKDPLEILDARYSAPEILDGQIDRTVDIYSAGTVAYQLLTGKEPPEKLRKKLKVKEAGGSFITDMTAPKPGDRPQSFGGLRTYF